MNTIRFESPIPGAPNYRADALVDDSAYEVFIEPRDIRQLRASLVDLAQVSAVPQIRRAILVLEEPKITERRLREEWQRTLAVMRPEIAGRLRLYLRVSGEWTGLPETPDLEEIRLLEKILYRLLPQKIVPPARSSEAYYEILRILIHHWLLNQGRVPIHELMKASGKSHPTVSRALKRLNHYLIRHTDRSVELRFFPTEEWEKLVAHSDDVRSTVRFVDRSGQPRSAESLFNRLQKLKIRDVAVGGVIGAKHYLPSLDIIGTPRLDLSVLPSAAGLSFVKKLDPALKESTDRNETPLVVIHHIHRAESFFQPDEETGVLWADPVECLLDLHDARLEPQALEFLKSFPS